MPRDRSERGAFTRFLFAASGTRTGAACDNQEPSKLLVSKEFRVCRPE